MKKNDVFTFIDSNGVEVMGVVLDKALQIDCLNNVEIKYLCYAQNRLFYYVETYWFERGESTYAVGDSIVDSAVLPDYDNALEDYQHQLDIADDYASREL